MSFDIDDIRNRLLKIRRKNRIGIMELSKDIGIYPTTLQTFIDSKRDTSYHSLCLIEDWVKAKESEDNEVTGS